MSRLRILASVAIGALGLFGTYEGVLHMTGKVTAASIQGSNADTAGEYWMFMHSSADLLNLAIERKVIGKDELAEYEQKFRSAKNAWEVMKVQNLLLRKLYVEAVDYSDILFDHQIIDYPNYTALKANLARGKEFTTRDQEDADHLDALAERAANGEELPTSAATEIFSTLDRMKHREKLFPQK